MAPVLETVGLEKHFGGLTAVAGLSLKIEKGARHALIGRASCRERVSFLV